MDIWIYGYMDIWIYRYIEICMGVVKEEGTDYVSGGTKQPFHVSHLTKLALHCTKI